MLIRWFFAAIHQAEWLVCDGPDFELSQRIRYLADVERTAFAGRVGAGVADLFMNALGYTWRDNASSVLKYSIAHADFLYGGGRASGQGVVLAEAHGSFAGRISQAEISRRGKKKYDRQVRPYVGKRSAYGAIIHGYSVAFGCRPGSVGAFLHLSETQIPGSGNAGMSSSEMENDSDNGASPEYLVLATFRANFCLIGAQIVVSWLDWIRGERMRPREIGEQHFSIIGVDGRNFLICADTYSVQHESRKNGSGFFGQFAVEQNTAEQFLRMLTDIIGDDVRAIERCLDLPEVEHHGFGINAEYGKFGIAESRRAYVLYRDGLALINRRDYSEYSPIGYQNWNPQLGIRAIESA